MTTAVPVTPKDASLGAAARPFVMLVVAAFAVGFMSYIALGRPLPVLDASSPAATVAAEPTLASPASDDWNLPKHI